MPSPDHAYPWAYFKALSHFVGSLSPFLLGITFQSWLCAAPLNVICFVPAMGIIPGDSGFFPSPVCEVIHIAAVMHYELCKPSVCVLRLDPLTQARSVNGQDFCFSEFQTCVGFAVGTPQATGASHHLCQCSSTLRAICFFPLLVLFVFACSSLWTLTL